MLARHYAKLQVLGFFALLFFTVPVNSKAQQLVTYQTIASGLSNPVDIVSPKDGTNRLFIVQQRGTIRIWDGDQLLSTPFLDISGLLAPGDERGLLSMAFHPDYKNNGLFYVYYNNTAGDVT